MHNLGWYIGPVYQASIGTNTWPMGDIYLLPSSVLMFGLYGWNKSMLGIQNNWGGAIYAKLLARNASRALGICNFTYYHLLSWCSLYLWLK